MGINDFNGNNQIDVGDIQLRKENLKKQNPAKYLEILEQEVTQKLQDPSLESHERKILKDYLSKTTKTTQTVHQKRFEIKTLTNKLVTNQQKPKEWYHLKWARENLKLGDKRIKRAEEEFLKVNNGLRVTQMKVATSNDNLFNSKGEDDGKSFGLHAEIKAQKGEKDYYMKADFDGFTKNPDFHKMSDGEYTGEGKGERTDRFQFSVGQENIDLGDNIRGKIGLGVEKTGNLGGEKYIQNAWHKGLGKGTMEEGKEYTVHGKYDEGTLGGYVEGGIDWKSNRKNGLYIGGDVKGKLIAVGEGGSFVDFKAIAGYKGKFFEAELGAGHKKDYQPSSTIAYGEPDADYIEMNGKVNLTKKLSLDAQYKHIMNSEKNGYGTIGLSYKF